MRHRPCSAMDAVALCGFLTQGTSAMRHIPCNAGASRHSTPSHFRDQLAISRCGSPPYIPVQESIRAGRIPRRKMAHHFTCHKEEHYHDFYVASCQPRCHLGARLHHAARAHPHLRSRTSDTCQKPSPLVGVRKVPRSGSKPRCGLRPDARALE